MKYYVSYAQVACQLQLPTQRCLLEELLLGLFPPLLSKPYISLVAVHMFFACLLLFFQRFFFR